MTYHRPRYVPRPASASYNAAAEYLERQAVQRGASAVLGDIQAVRAAYTCALTDGLILGDATTAAFAVTLPSVVTGIGQWITVKKTDASVNAVTVTRAGTALIDGAATYALTARYQSVTVLSDGTNWWVL